MSTKAAKPDVMASHLESFYAMFLDWSQAFDSVSHSALRNALQRVGEDNVLHHLYKVAAHFKAKQEQDATWQLGQNPLRMVLAIALFKEVTDRLNQTIASQEKLKRAVDQGWRDPQAGWRYQVWNHKTKQLQVDTSRPPIPEDKLLDHFATILQCLRQPIVNRFRCTRRLTETMSSPATFKLDMSVRSHSALTMWDTLKMLQGNAVFQLAGMAYKTESLARGPVEQKIAEMVYGRRSWHGLWSNFDYRKHSFVVQVLTDDPRWLTLIDDWGEARSPTMAGETQLVDTGIQSLVDTWCRGIDRIHGLTVAPPVILLQLHRFTKQRDRVLKNHLKVQLDHVIQMPFFSGDRHNLSHRSYKLKAFIEHHGATPTSGHYTANLVNDEGSWSCDDGRAAKVKTMRGERHPTKTGYALFYSLDAALATSSDEGLSSLRVKLKLKQEKKEKAKEKPPPPPRRTPTPSPARSESQKNLSDYEGELSRSPSRPKKRRAAPSGSPERVPPTQFEDYEPAGDGSGWYVYKKTAKWKFHPETGLYFHLKTQVYYTPKESDNRFFRRIDDDDDPLVKKMKQSEEMRRAISKTEFVKFEVEGAQGEDGSARAEEPAPAPKAPEKEEDTRMDGRVNKWDSEKGFGFIMPAGKEEGGEVGKGLFVHRKFIVGSTPTNPINLKEGVKVSFKQGTQDGKPCALEVLMLGADGKPLPIHAGAQTLEEKKKSYHVSAESLGLRVHCESWPGLKKTLQDRYVMDEPLEELGVYFAVLDGHGGTQVADMVKEKLHKNVLQQMRQKQVQPASRDEKIKLAIKEAFLQTDKEILALAERKKFELVGSTCVSVILHGNPKLGTALRLVVSNLGDSRAVLCRAGQAVPASEDHRPTRIDEKKRIERVGGLVLQVRGAWRVATSTNPNSMNKAARREYQGLAMTRSFGDLHFKRPIGLAIAEPEVRIVPLSDKDLFIVLATDGVYDVLSNQEVIDLAMRHWREPEEAAKNIVRSAYKRGSEDNLTVLVVQFGGTS
ncbi:unnamed protein product [Symbiodinium sp. CCMP2592]|nr:unnamed protein product [Symbiodinium sp. CCMP2592]